jgi:mycothiol system anti-sigma-R factor
MSCGQPHDTDCAEILDRVYLFLDRELAEEDISYQAVEQHLDECGPCLSKYDLESVVKALVARSCGCERAPAALRQRVLTRIHQIRIEITDS